MAKLQEALQAALQALFGGRPVKVLVFPDNGIKVKVTTKNIFVWKDLEQTAKAQELKPGTFWIDVVSLPRQNSKGHRLIKIRKGQITGWVREKYLTEVV